MSERGGVRTGIVALVGALVLVAGAGAAVGFGDTADARTGEDVLEDVQERYKSAESVSADATVTVRTDEYESSYDVAVATADGDQFRLNVTRENRSVLVGSDGETAWVNGPDSGVTVAVERTDDDTLALRVLAGTERPRGLSITDVLDAQGIDPNTTVAAFVDRIDTERLPANVTERLEELPENTTLADLAQGEGLGDLADDPAVANLTERLPNASSLSGAFEDSEFAAALEDGSLEADELPEAFDRPAVREFLTALEDGSLEADELPEAFDRPAVREFLADIENGTLTLPARDGDESVNVSAALADLRDGDRPEWATGEFEPSVNNLTVERVGTTDVDGREAVEVAITHPEYEGETRVWAATDTDELLKMRTTGPNGTATVDVHETRFNVSAADSTFEPPGAVTLLEATIERTDDPATFGSSAPYEVATPGEEWTFEGGVTATLDTSSVPVEGLPEETVAVAAAYSGAGADADTDTEDPSLVVAQTETELDLAGLSGTEFVVDDEAFEVEVETTTVEGRDVVIRETDDGTVATWVEDGTTVVVAGDIDAEALRTVVAELGD